MVAKFEGRKKNTTCSKKFLREEKKKRNSLAKGERVAEETMASGDIFAEAS